MPIPSAFKLVELNAKANKTTPVIAQDFRGFLPMVFATFDQGPDIT